MKYYYTKSENEQPIYGEKVILNDQIYKLGTLYFQDEKGLIVVQKRFTSKYVYWDSLDNCLANDIYLNPNFPSYFNKHAKPIDYPIIQVRKLMWALRMKPLPKEPWEDYF